MKLTDFIKSASANNALIAENQQKVFEAGKAQASDVTKNPMYYMVVKGFHWNAQKFPEGFDFVLNVRDKPDDLNAGLMRATGVKTVTLICEAEGTVSYSQLLRESTVEILDITNFKPIPTDISYLAYGCKNLVSILGVLDLSSCTKATIPFSGATAFKDIRFKEGTISLALSFVACSLLSEESVQSIIDGLADLTGGAAQKLEFHSTTSSKLTDEQILQIAAKNWITN